MVCPVLAFYRIWWVVLYIFDLLSTVLDFDISPFWMYFLATRKPWDRFCSNFQWTIVTKLSIDSNISNLNLQFYFTYSTPMSSFGLRLFLLLRFLLVWDTHSHKYTRVFLLTFTHAHTDACTCIHIYTHVHSFKDTRAFVHARTSAYMHKHLGIWAFTHQHKHSRICTNIREQARTFAYVHEQTRTFAHMHALVHVPTIACTPICIRACKHM